MAYFEVKSKIILEGLWKLIRRLSPQKVEPTYMTLYQLAWSELICGVCAGPIASGLLTVSVDCGNVGPVVPADDVNHDLRLVVVRRHYSKEVAEAALVTQVLAGGGVAYLRDLEQLQ